MQTDYATDDIAAGFPVPFTKDALKKDILDVMLILINQTRFTFFRDSNSEAQLWALLSKRPIDFAFELANPDMTPVDLGLSFPDIEGIEMVQTLMEFYDFGVHGILDTSKPCFDDSDGSGNCLSRILYDLRRSKFLEDWTGYKSEDLFGAVDRCLLITELANARLMLESGREGFFLGHQGSTLSIRQISLLSGMTEASIRTLAGPNRKNRLITKKNGNNTVIEIEDARAWLISKGRYIPIKKTSARGAEDFTGRKFFSRDEFEEAIGYRREFLINELGEEVVNQRIANSGIVKVDIPHTNIFGTFKGIGNEQLLNTDLMRRLSEVLELPTELFVLRAAEAVTHEQLRAIETQLKQIQTGSTR
jgi:hypothetical protein